MTPELRAKGGRRGGLARAKRCRLDPEFNEIWREKMRNSTWDKPSFLGKNHSAETKKIIGEKNSKHQKGSGNSQFNTMWITNEEINKKVPKNDLIPKGWRKGRVMGR